MRIRQNATLATYGLAGILVLVVVWSCIARIANEPARFPTGTDIFGSLVDNFWYSPALERSTLQPGGMASSIAWTGSNVLLAVFVGLLVGYLVGLALARSQWFARIWSVPIAIVGTVPVLALYPFLTLWFGTSRLAMGGMVVFYSAITIIESVRSAVLMAQQRWGDYAACLGSRGLLFVRTVLLPPTVPRTIGTIRVSLAFGWGFQALAEVLGGSRGSGRMVRAFSQATDTAGVIGVLVCIGIAAVLVDAAVAGIGRWTTRWAE